MTKRKTISIFVFLLLISLQGFSQNKNFKCPWDEINCVGKCGSFYDADGDGYCDYGIVEKPEVIEVIIEEPKDTFSNNDINNSIDTSIIVQDSLIEDVAQNTDSNKIQETSVLKQNKLTPPNKPRRYNFILISSLVFGLYFLSFILSKRKIIRKCNHRRIWNILLALTFLGSGIIGLILVIQLDYNIWMSIYRDFLYWHVQFGIAMSLIAILHIFWHWKYFKSIFKGWKRTNICE